MFPNIVAWYITKEINNKMYYLQDYDKRGMSLWTAKAGQGVRFETAVLAQSYCRNFLNDRKDVSVQSLNLP